MPAGVTALSMEIEIFRNFVTLFMRTLLGLFLFIFCLLGCTRSKEEEAHLKLFDETTPTKEAFQVRFVFSEDAVVQAELEAPHAIEATENGQDIRIFDKGLHMTFYTKEGQKESELTSKHGTFKNQFNDALLYGDVVMLNSKGDRLTADTLYWNKIKNRIKAKPTIKNNRVTRPVMIHTATEIIYGDSLDSNTDFTEYKIFGITGSVNVKDEEL